MRFRIIVPLDGSQLSECALPWADRLGAALGASVELVQVLPRDLPGESAEAAVAFSRRLESGSAALARSPGEGEEPPSPEAERAREALVAARGRLSSAADADVLVLEGYAEEQIIARAQAEPEATTLIVMSTHARSGLGRAVLGSVADGVIRRSGVPVLALRPDIAPPGDPIRRVLVPLDGSPLAAAVIPPLLPFARALRWTLRLVSVLALPRPGLPVQGATIPLGPVQTPEPERILAHLESVAADAHQAEIPVETILAFGDRVEAISDQATSTSCGLIAMSTHGRRGLERWAIGSLTESLIRTGPVPVIAMHPSVSPSPAL